MNGEEVVGAVKIEKLKIEEGEERDFKGSTEMPADAIRSDPPSRLRITMSVKDT